MDGGKTKEVYFNQYCNACKYKDTAESEEPCTGCLAHGHNEYSHKPVNYEEKD